MDDLDVDLTGGTTRGTKQRRAPVLSSVVVAVCNTGGVPGIQRIIELMQLKKFSCDVLMIQELKASAHDIKVLETTFSLMGFY